MTLPLLFGLSVLQGHQNIKHHKAFHHFPFLLKQPYPTFWPSNNKIFQISLYSTRESKHTKMHH